MNFFLTILRKFQASSIDLLRCRTIILQESVPGNKEKKVKLLQPKWRILYWGPLDRCSDPWCPILWWQLQSIWRQRLRTCTSRSRQSWRFGKLVERFFSWKNFRKKSSLTHHGNPDESIVGDYAEHFHRKNSEWEKKGSWNEGQVSYSRIVKRWV